MNNLGMARQSDLYRGSPMCPPDFKPPAETQMPSAPSNPKKRRKTAAASANNAIQQPTAPPTPADLLPPPLTGYGDTIVASNPFDDTPPQSSSLNSMNHMNMNHHHHPHPPHMNPHPHMGGPIRGMNSMMMHSMPPHPMNMNPHAHAMSNRGGISPMAAQMGGLSPMSVSMGISQVRAMSNETYQPRGSYIKTQYDLNSKVFCSFSGSPIQAAGMPSPMTISSPLGKSIKFFLKHKCNYLNTYLISWVGQNICLKKEKRY